MKKTNIIVVLLSIFVLSGCSSLYPQLLIQNPNIEEDTSIVLFGIEGKEKVQYLQFCADELPCNNYRFEPVTNKILALRVSTPKNNFYFGTFAGEKVGFTSVISKSINIKQQGIYYYGTLDTDLLIIEQEENKEILKQAQKEYGHLMKNLKPVNFTW